MPNDLLGLVPADLVRTRPVYRHISRLLEMRIRNGGLTPGTRLPAERELARSLKVSRATVVSAYRDLESRGLVRGYIGRGTFISAVPDMSGAPFAWRGKVAAAALRFNDSIIRDLVKHSMDPALKSIAAGIPAIDRFPAEEFRSAVDRVLSREGRAVVSHGHTEGCPSFRQTIAERFGTSPPMVLVLAGAQQGLDLLARCLVDPGDTVVMDRPGYLGAVHTFRAAGARLVGWDTVRADIDELEDLLVRHRPKLVYTNPTFQNPTGWTMPIKLRREFLDLAARHRVPVIEDDTYRELFIDGPPPPSLHSLDTQSIVIHLNSFSKVLGPGLRLGWISAAEPIVEQLSLIKQRADPHTQTLIQLVVRQLIDEGTFDKHLAVLRAEHRRRRDGLLAAFERRKASPALRWTMPAGGLYLWCQLPPRVSADDVLKRSLADAIAFVPGRAFYVDHTGDDQMRVCFSSILPAHVDEVARGLARSVSEMRADTCQINEVPA